MAANCSRIVGQSRTRVKKQRAGSESDGGLHHPPVWYMNLSLLCITIIKVILVTAGNLSPTLLSSTERMTSTQKHFLIHKAARYVSLLKSFLMSVLSWSPQLKLMEIKGKEVMGHQIRKVFLVCVSSHFWSIFVCINMQKKQGILYLMDISNRRHNMSIISHHPTLFSHC